MGSFNHVIRPVRAFVNQKIHRQDKLPGFAIKDNTIISASFFLPVWYNRYLNSKYLAPIGYSTNCSDSFFMNHKIINEHSLLNNI